jgi:hypothetical protein
LKGLALEGVDKKGLNASNAIANHILYGTMKQKSNLVNYSHSLGDMMQTGQID